MRLALLFLLTSACVTELPVLFPYDGGMPVPSVSGGRFLSMGHRHTCDIRAGRLRCWGEGADNALGLGDTMLRKTPAFVDDGTDWASISTGEQHSCGLKADGSVWCFGSNQAGQLGVGDLLTRSTPTRVPLPHAARSLSTSYSHTCVVLSDASGWCWGANWEGQLGLADNHPGADQPSPQPISGNAQWRVIEPGQGHTCGIQNDGSLWCWGRNDRRHLGLGVGSPQQVRPPTRIGTRTDWKAVSSSQEGTCSIANDDSVWCQGGSFETGISEYPVATRLGTASWHLFRTDTFHACGLQLDGSLWCLGRGIEGQLGLGDLNPRGVLTQVGTDTDWVDVQVGRFHTCARKGNGSLFCTGENVDGRLGVGDLTRRRAFTLVP